MRWLVLLLAALLSAAAPAAERGFAIGSFERVRIEGPFEVAIETGRPPSVRAEGDRQLIEQIDVVLNGTTLVVRMGSRGWGETPAAAATKVARITLATPRLSGATLVSGARVTIGRMAAPRVDLSVTGAGALDVKQVETDQLAATLIGAGSMAMGGTAARARLTVNGPGAIDASGLRAGDLVVRVEGTGETRASARYTAQVTTTGLGKVSVTGTAKCIVKAVAGGPVSCGAK